MDGTNGRMDRPMDGRTDAWMGTGVALFGCGDGCLGLSGFSVCSSFSAGALTGSSPSDGISAPSPFCFCFGGGGLCAGRLGFVLGSSCFTASSCLSGLSTFGLIGMDVWTDAWTDGRTKGMMDGTKDDSRTDGTMDTPTDGRTDVCVRVDVVLFNCGDGCLGWSGFSGSSFSAGALTGGSPSGGKSAPSPFCFCFGGGGLCAGRLGFVLGSSCFTASACLSGFSVDVALFNRGDGCLGRSGFSGCSSFSAGSVTGGVSTGDNSASSFCLRSVTLGGGGLWAGRIGLVVGTCFTRSACLSISSGFSTLSFSVSFDVVALGGGLDGFLSSCLGIVASGDDLDCMERCFTGGGLAGFISSSVAIVASGDDLDCMERCFTGGGLAGFISSSVAIVASGDDLDCMERCFTGGGLAGFISSSVAIVASGDGVDCTERCFTSSLASGGGVALCTSGEDCRLSGSFPLSAGAVVRGGEGVVLGIDGFLATGGLSCALLEGLISVDGGGDGEGFCLTGGLPGEEPVNTSVLVSVSPGDSSAPSSFCFCCATLGGGGLWAGRVGFVVGVSCFTASACFLSSSPEPVGSGETSCTVVFSCTSSLSGFMFFFCASPPSCICFELAVCLGGGGCVGLLGGLLRAEGE